MPRIESNPDHFGPAYTIVRNIALGWLLSAPHLFRAAFDMFALGGGFIFFVDVLVHNVVEKATGVVLPVWVGASVYILFFQAIFFDTIPGKRFIDKVLFCMLGFIFVSHILLLYLVWTMFSMVWVVLAEMVFCIALVFVVAAYTFLKKRTFFRCRFA